VQNVSFTKHAVNTDENKSGRFALVHIAMWIYFYIIRYPKNQISKVLKITKSRSTKNQSPKRSRSRKTRTRSLEKPKSKDPEKPRSYPLKVL
jgi:hypothetical protein